MLFRNRAMGAASRNLELASPARPVIAGCVTASDVSRIKMAPAPAAASAVRLCLTFILAQCADKLMRS
jgi:hypothetical protein